MFPRGSRRRGRRHDAYAGPELVVAVDDNGFTGSDAALDQRVAVAAGGDPDGVDFYRGVLPDNEGVAAARSRLQRGFRHDRSAADTEQQVCADELAGPKSSVKILKDRLESDRACALIDLVVDQLKTAFSQLDAVVLIIRRYDKGPAAHRIDDLRRYFCGKVKITLIGAICVTTTSPPESEA